MNMSDGDRPASSWHLQHLHGWIYRYTHTSMHTYTYTYTHTRTHAHTQTHTHTHMRAHAHTYKHTRTHTQTNTHARTHTHTRARTQTHTHTHTRTHTHRYLYDSHSRRTRSDLQNATATFSIRSPLPAAPRCSVCPLVAVSRCSVALQFLVVVSRCHGYRLAAVSVTSLQCLSHRCSVRHLVAMWIASMQCRSCVRHFVEVSRSSVSLHFKSSCSTVCRLVAVFSPRCIVTASPNPHAPSQCLSLCGCV